MFLPTIERLYIHRNDFYRLKMTEYICHFWEKKMIIQIQVIILRVTVTGVKVFYDEKLIWKDRDGGISGSRKLSPY